jgi:hypothetical protein
MRHFHKYREEKMKNILRRSVSLIVMITVFCGFLVYTPPAAQVQAAPSAEDVIAETQEFMRRNGISFEKANYSFENTDASQSYTVTSEDSTVFQKGGSFQKAVSVINVKAADGTGGIYVGEVSFEGSVVTYSLKKDGQLAATAQIDVALPGPGNPTGPTPCAGDMTWAEVQARIAAAQARANATCRMQMTTYQYRCAIYCFVRIYPTDPRCRRFAWEEVAVESVLKANIGTFRLEP